jgi:hypothetical protein
MAFKGQFGVRSKIVIGGTTLVQINSHVWDVKVHTKKERKKERKKQRT